MILVEPSATNLLPYSEDFDAGNWAKVALGTGSNPVITPDYAVSPDGTQNASRIQFDKGSGTAGTDLSILRYNFSITNGLTLSKSVYLKSNTADTYNLVLHDSADASGTNVKKLTVTPEWQRFDVYGVAPGTSTGISFGLRNINVTGVSNTADVLVWGAQVESGSVATSLIPTAGSTAQRAADDLVITGSAFDFYNGSEGTFYMELIDKNILDSTSHLFLHAGGNNLILYSNGNSANVANYDGANFLQFSGIPSNQLIRMALSYASSTKKLSVNGNTSSDSPYNGNYSGISSLYLGTNLSGHIKRVLFWPYSSDRL
jgi:hypothetical protein